MMWPPEAVVSINQAYDWFVTITGVKVEELSLNTAQDTEIVSTGSGCPVKYYSYNGGTFGTPQTLVK